MNEPDFEALATDLIWDGDIIRTVNALQRIYELGKAEGYQDAMKNSWWHAQEADIEKVKQVAKELVGEPINNSNLINKRGE